MNSQSLIPFVITKDHNGDIIKKQYRPKRILESLLVETSISLEDAKDITKKTSRYIVSSGITLTTAPFIREVVNTLLVKNGLVNIRNQYTRLGTPIYELNKRINKYLVNLILLSKKDLTKKETIRKRRILRIRLFRYISSENIKEFVEVKKL